jgi:molybdopterin/thiamine biosynthesis adenylyltransferase
MTEQVSNRHEGDLGGVFLPFGEASKLELTVMVDPQSAGLASVQHTAWMLVNLLVRLEGIVQQIHVISPGVPLHGRIVPLAPRHLDLQTALIEGARAVDVVPADEKGPSGRILVVGDGNAWEEAADLYVLGNGWCGGICTSPIASDYFGARSLLPFGPYTAACIAAAEVFKAVRMNPENYRAVRSVFYSLWRHRASAVPMLDGPPAIEIAVDAALAGVGAVGSAFLHALWACDGIQGSILLADNDKKGLDRTNLNRYVLFGSESVGSAKATEAARMAADATISWQPHDTAIEGLANLPPRVVSAVDTNQSRQAIQNRYPPRILSGSTLDLRAEVLRCGPPGVGACLRCYNPPEKIPADEDLRSQLRSASDEKLVELANAAGISIEDANEWARTGQCGLAGERLLPYLRPSPASPMFAVGFVSAMAGTMLSAEFIKDHLEGNGPLSGSTPRVTFQFHSPLANANRASGYSRDPACPMCDPTTIPTQKWRQRFDQLGPMRL